MDFKKINLKKYFDNTFWLIFAGFFAVRLLSFLLVGHVLWENIISLIVIIVFILIYFKNNTWGFIFLLTEIAIGGSGVLLEFNGIALRTCLLLLFLLFYYWQIIFYKKYKKIETIKEIYYLLLPLFILILLAAVIGLYHGHSSHQVIADLIPFSYLFLIIPSIEYLPNKLTREHLIKLGLVLLFGSAVWALFNFVLFTTGFHLIHDNYYKWLRDVNLGKITQVTQYYYRIVFPEHLLVVPLLLLINSYWIKYKNNVLMLTIISGAIILALNFSRGYFLGLIFGFMLLLYKNNWKNWLHIVLRNCLLIILIFSAVNFLASNGKSLGWEILGLRISSLVVPTIEESSNNRLLLLSPINQLIADKPWFGNGLGQTINFTNNQGKTITTSQFDWGYLEMWAEWGLLALIIFLITIISLIKKLFTKLQKNQVFYLGLLAGILSMLVINITVPALFHVLGIFYLTILFALTMSENDWWQKLSDRLK